MAIDASYDPVADVAVFRVEDYVARTVRSEPNDVGRREFDPSDGRLIGVICERAGDRLPSDLIAALKRA